jgi:YD repeat-containing protein
MAMVAIVTGNGVGLGKGSSEVLGQGGQLGLGQLPGAAGTAYVNASNGNLVIQRQDELLIGRGPDIGVYQTYNSQGGLDFDNNDNWQVSLYRQLSGRTGSLNGAGSTITRTGADGTPLVYTYDSAAGSATLGKYVNKDGSGSFDTLTYTAGTNSWVWQDGNTRIKESYAVDPTDSTKWRITGVTDLDNNSLTYTYSTVSGLTTLIDKVTSANGEITQLIYNATKQLTQINVINSSSVTTTRIRYTYESTATTARLTSVSTDLTPSDGTIADGKTYTTSYTYDGTSKRIASITNGDGSKVSFTYETSGSFRLLTISGYASHSSVIDNTTTLNYTSATTTTVTNTNNAGTSLVTTLTYDTNKQLTNILGPSGSGQNTSYTYNGNGDITQVTDSRGNWTKYTYDAQGNQLTQQDNLGNTIVRTYDSTATGFNQLLTETVYTGVDATPGDATVAGTGTAQTTRYTYDSKNHVRYTISPEGRVTEYRYSPTNGQLTSTHQYIEHLFTTPGNQTETQMNTWLTAAIKSKSQRTDYLYDARGQLSETVVYTKVNATSGNEGNGMADGTQMRTQYVYDQSGNLKQTIDARGVASATANDYMTSYSYDGLNRLTLTKQYDATGLETKAVSTVTAYNETNRQVILTLANGLVTTSTYDLAGRLISVQKSDSVNTTAGSLGTTSYLYDKLGNLRRVAGPVSQNTYYSYYLYDSANRKVGEIDENKNLTEWVYNANGQVIRTIQYKNTVTATLDATTALTNSLETTGVRPAADATNDRTSYRVYDQAGRLSHEIDALGYVTEYQYDGASRLLRTLEYNTAISAANLALIQSSTTDIYGINGSLKGISGIVTTNTLTLTANATTDRANRNLYDNDGKLVGTLDAEGYLTEYVYDKAGRQTQKIRYATVTGSANWTTGNLSTLKANATAVSADASKHQTTNYIYDAEGQLTGVVDAENFLTEYQYDLVGNKTQEIRYATSISYVAGNTVIQSRPASSNEDQKVTNTYDANNRILSSLSNTQGQVNGLLTNYTYDNMGNLTQTVKTFTGATNTQERVQLRQYDSRGNMTAELTGEGVIALLALGSTPSDFDVSMVWYNYGTRYHYNVADQLTMKVEPSIPSIGDTRTVYYYDGEGKLTYTINALGEVNQTIYNSFDQVAETRRYNTRIPPGPLSGMTGGLEAWVTGSSSMIAVTTGSYSNIQLGYDKRGQLASTTDELLNVNSRSYNAFGELNNKTDKVDSTTNLITSYQYDRKGQLKATTEDSGGSLSRISERIDYDAFGRAISKTDANYQFIQYKYDRLGRTVVTTDAQSRDTTVTYDAFDRKVSVVDRRGNTTSWSYNTINRTMTMTTAENISVVTTANQFGEVVKVTNGRGSNTTYTYNQDGQLTQTVEDIGSGKLNITQSTTYDKSGRVYQTTDPKGTVTQYSYDITSRVLSKTIDPTGLNLVTNYRYDAQGRQIWTQDANNVWTRMDYDAKGQLTKVVTDPANIPTTNTSGVVTGTTVNSTGLNLTTSYTYTARGKKLTVIEGDGSASARTTQYVYDKLGRLTSSIVDPGTGKLNLTTKYVYDAVDNVVMRTVANNSTVYTYNSENRVSVSVDNLGYPTRYDYDGNGNLIKTRIYANKADFGVGGSLLTLQASPANTGFSLVESSDDHIMRYAYDKDNRLTYTTDADGYVTRNEYDANGNVVKHTRYYAQATAVSETGGIPTVQSSFYDDHVEQTVYDAANRAIYSIDAENYMTANSYDANGNVVSSTRYANVVVGTLATNTPPQILATAGTGNYVITSSKDQLTRYSYDKANRRIFSMEAAGSVTQYDYDKLGQTLKVTRYGNAMVGTPTVGAPPSIVTTAPGSGNYVLKDITKDQVVEQKFDAAGRKTEAIDAEGKSAKTEYNAAGDIVKVTDALGNAGFFYYDGAGRVTLQVDPEGAVTQTQYDGLGNVTQVLRFASKVQTSGTGVLNANASIQIVSAAPGGNHVYVLIDTAKDQKQTTEYDQLGQKRTVKTWTGLTSGNASTDFYTESFTYDAFGNASTIKARNGATTTYTYDKLNRKTSEILPVTASGPDGVIPVKNTFIYDSFGNLDQKIEADGALTWRRTGYVYDRSNQKIQTSQLIGTIFGDDILANSYHTYDARGNLISESDPNGNLTYYYYDKQDRRTASVKMDGSYTAWTYDALGNVGQETRYANKVQVSGSETLSAASNIQLVGAAPGGNAVYLITDAVNDRSTYYTYDKVGRLTGTEIRNVTTTTTYNTTTQQYPVVFGSITVSTVYDSMGNIIKQIDGNGNLTRSWYNKAGQIIAKLDPENYLTVWTRDVYGNISQETRYANKIQTVGTATMTDSGVPEILTTTPTGNRVYVLTDGTNDRTTVISYDKLNRVSSETVNNVQAGTVNATTGVLTAATPISATTSYQYDGLNNITQKTDAASGVTNWVYDGLGRELSVSGPQQTDFENYTVRTRTDKEYDGLNNVTREIRRGRDNAVETDDQITTYTYEVGGRLLSETDATGAVTEYQYDYNGNITQETQKNRKTADQIAAGTNGVDDVTTFTYDALNRQVTTTDVSSGLVQEVQYNSFDQVTGKRSYVGTAPTTWDEFAEYDRTGRIWKSNSGDGVTKVYLNDKNGNVTVTITDNAELRNMTLAAILQMLDASTIVQPNATTKLTLSIYDKKNQLATTIQPTMEVGARSPLTTNPLIAGNVSTSYGTVSWSYDWDRVGSSNHKDYYLKPTFTIPPSLGLSGNTKLELTVTATNGHAVITNSTVVIPQDSLSASSRFFIGRFVDVDVTISLSLRLVQSTTQGDIVLGTQTYSGGLGGGGNIIIPSRMYIANQPYIPGDAAKSTAKVLLSYRPAGTNQAYTTISVPNVVNKANAGIGGLYAFNWTTLASGNYEFEYVAINEAGQILNQQKGNLNTSTLSKPTQNSIEFGEVGRAFFSNTVISDMSSGLQLVNQGPDAASVIMRYRLKNTTGSWITPSTSFSAYQADKGFGIGSFVLNPTGLNTMVNGNDYDVEFDIKNVTGTILRTVTATIKKDSSGNLSIGALINTATTSPATNVEIKRSQSYNAFGEIISETDGRGNVTSYTYNTMGAMTKKIAPQVSITTENGSQQNVTPTIEYTYDTLGRVIAVKDANGNVNTQVWVAGNVVLERHADSGLKVSKYDIFGNKRQEFDELATSYTGSANDAIHRTDYTYDKENRMLRVDHQAQSVNGPRSYDEYAYDAAGNRVSHTTSSKVGDATQIANTRQIEKTYYDSLGRVIKSTSFQGFNTNYSYAYVNNIVGIGGATNVGGWQKTTTDTMGRTLVDKTDMFNRVTWHQDLGGHQFTYAYNRMGWLTSQTSLGAGSAYTGQNIVYDYYNNGNIKTIHDKALGMYTYYEYDKDGNRTFEGYISLKEASNFAAGAKDFYQYATITYDAMNRMTSMADPKANVSYEYDAVGNRRMVKSTYHDGANGSLQVQEYWYKYDSMNRFLITMGTLNGVRGGTSTAITIGALGTNTTDSNSDGVSISYNKAGQRVQASYAKKGSVENYTYTNDGFLVDVNIKESNQSAAVLRSRRVNDALGRVTTYNEYATNGTTVNYTKTTNYDKDNRATQETGTDGTTNYYYYINSSDSSTTATSAGGGQLARVENLNSTTVNTYYAYEYWDEAKQFAITNQGYNPTLRDNNAFWKSGYSELKYDVNGHLAGANDAGSDGNRGTADDRSFRYVSDAQGLILLRDEIAANSVNKVQRYYYVDGKRVGDVGNEGPSRTDYVQAMAGRGTSKTDYKNFRPIASADFDQNYEPISPTYPGFVSSTYTVRGGDTLQSIARTVWGDADMWYLIADANGLAQNSELVTGQMLTIPNKVTNIRNNSGTYRVYNPGEAIGDVSPTLPTAPPPPQKKKKKCGGLAGILVAVVTIAVAVVTQQYHLLANPLWNATAAAAAGNVAGQITANALGIQKGFDFKSFTTAVVSAGVTQGLVGGTVANPTGTIGTAIKEAVGTGYAAIAARAVVGNVVNQGIGNMTGSQKGFSWSSVAISGIGAAGGAALTDKFKLTKNYGADINGTDFGDDLGRAATTAGAFALTQLFVKGGKVNWQQLATDTVTGLIQNRAESNVVKKASVAPNTYGDIFDLDLQQALYFGGGDSSTNALSPSIVRLSEDEVIANAMASQDAKLSKSMLEESDIYQSGSYLDNIRKASGLLEGNFDTKVPEVWNGKFIKTFGEVGHYSTMATVLYLAGFSPEDSKAIALAAWGPDTDSRNAMTYPNFGNGKNSEWPQIKDHFLDGEQDPKQVVADQLVYAQKVKGILQEIKLHQNDISFKTEYLSRLDVQDTLHKFGDAFAHVQQNGTRYKPKIGHAVESLSNSDPDSPNTHPEAYKNYVKTLFSVASEVNGIPRVRADFVSDLAAKVTNTISTISVQKQILSGAIGSVTKSQAASMVNSPVKEGSLPSVIFNYSKIDAGSRVNPFIKDILNPKKK